jgi:transposase InsO family protein
VRLEFIQPDKPVQNTNAESFNGRLRDECLNANWFTSLSDARQKIESWRQTSCQGNPSGSLLAPCFELPGPRHGGYEVRESDSVLTLLVGISAVAPLEKRLIWSLLLIAVAT